MRVSIINNIVHSFSLFYLAIVIMYEIIVLSRALLVYYKAELGVLNSLAL